MKLSRQDQRCSSVSSTWDPNSAFFQPFSCHPRIPRRIFLVFDAQIDIPSSDFFPIQVQTEFPRTVLLPIVRQTCCEMGWLLRKRASMQHVPIMSWVWLGPHERMYVWRVLSSAEHQQDWEKCACDEVLSSESEALVTPETLLARAVRVHQRSGPRISRHKQASEPKVSSLHAVCQFSSWPLGGERCFWWRSPLLHSGLLMIARRCPSWCSLCAETHALGKYPRSPPPLKGARGSLIPRTHLAQARSLWARSASLPQDETVGRDAAHMGDGGHPPIPSFQLQFHTTIRHFPWESTAFHIDHRVPQEPPTNHWAFPPWCDAANVQAIDPDPHRPSQSRGLPRFHWSTPHCPSAPAHWGHVPHQLCETQNFLPWQTLKDLSLEPAAWAIHQLCLDQILRFRE